MISYGSELNPPKCMRFPSKCMRVVLSAELNTHFVWRPIFLYGELKQEEGRLASLMPA